MEQYGIKETKEVIDFGIVLGVALKNSLVDGKIDLTDLPNAIPAFVALAPALESIGMVPKEIGDLSAEEGEELVAYVAIKLPQITDRPKLIKIVNASLKFGLAGLQLVTVIRSPEAA